MTARSLNNFRHTRQLFIDTATLRHLRHLHRHYKTRLLEIGRLSDTVLATRDGDFAPLGHYTVRVQDDKTIQDIEIFINNEGEIMEQESITISSPDEADADKAEFERQLDEIDEYHPSAELKHQP